MEATVLFLSSLLSHYHRLHAPERLHRTPDARQLEPVRLVDVEGPGEDRGCSTLSPPMMATTCATTRRADSPFAPRRDPPRRTYGGRVRARAAQWCGGSPRRTPARSTRSTSALRGTPLRRLTRQTLAIERRLHCLSALLRLRRGCHRRLRLLLRGGNLRIPLSCGAAVRFPLVWQDVLVDGAVPFGPRLALP